MFWDCDITGGVSIKKLLKWFIKVFGLILEIEKLKALCQAKNHFRLMNWLNNILKLELRPILDFKPSKLSFTSHKYIDRSVELLGYEME